MGIHLIYLRSVQLCKQVIVGAESEKNCVWNKVSIAEGMQPKGNNIKDRPQ